MRKILIAALALIMLLSLTGCIGRKVYEALQPAEEPTAVPTAVPTEAPTPEPTEEPTPEPTEEPTPTPEPTQKPLEAADLVGVWSITKIKYGESVLSPSDFGMEMYLEFREDGTVRAVSNEAGELEDESETYVVEDGVVRIGSGSSAGELIYDPETDELSFSSDEGEQMTIVLSRTPDAVIPSATAEPAADEQTKSFVGTWELSYAMVGEMKVDKDMLGETQMTLVLNEDGSAALRNQNQSVDMGITWKIESENVIGLYAYDVMKLYDVTFDPQENTLMLLEEESGVKMYFEKTA